MNADEEQPKEPQQQSASREDEARELPSSTAGDQNIEQSPPNADEEVAKSGLKGASPKDLHILDEILAAAQAPCPTADVYYNAAATPWVVDPLVHVLERPDVNAVMVRLLTSQEAYALPWWGGQTLGHGYEEARRRFILRAVQLRQDVAVILRGSHPTPLPAHGDQKRSTIDQDVERAFDLLGHYKDALLGTVSSVSIKQREGILTSIEESLRKWLPRAQAAHCALIDQVAAVIGDRDAAGRLLAGVELWPLRLSCLQEVAADMIASRLRSASPTAVCREEIQHWRTLLPPIRRRHDGQRYVDLDDRRLAWAVGWSGNLDSRLSRIGASYSVAAACDVVAKTALQVGVPRESIQQAIRLAHHLRETPDCWTPIDSADVLRVVDEQIELAREVEVLLGEIEISAANSERLVAEGIAKVSTAEAPLQQLAGNAVPASAAVSQVDAQPAVEESKMDERLDFSEAITGRADSGLEPVPESTLRRWLREKDSAKVLGVDSGGIPAVKRPLLRGLLALQKAGRAKRRTPKAPVIVCERCDCLQAGQAQADDRASG